MRGHAKRILKLAAGWTFILLGLAGLVLPFLQGILFLIIGLLILSTESEWAHRLLHRLRESHPKVAAAFDHAQRRLHDWMRRLRPPNRRKSK